MSVTPAQPIRPADPLLTVKPADPAAPPPPPAPPEAKPEPKPDPTSTAHRQDSVAMGQTPLVAEPSVPAPPPVPEPGDPQAVGRLAGEPGQNLPSADRLNSALRVAEMAGLDSSAGKQQAQSLASEVKPIVEPLRERMGVPPEAPKTVPPAATPAAAAPPDPSAWLGKKPGSLNLNDLAEVAKLASAKNYPDNLAKLQQPQRALVRFVNEAGLSATLLAAPAKLTLPADKQALAANVQTLSQTGQGLATLKAYAAVLPKAQALDPGFNAHIKESAEVCLSVPFIAALEELGQEGIGTSAAQLSNLITTIDTLASKGLGDALTLDPALLKALHTAAKLFEGQKTDPKLSLVPARLKSLLQLLPTHHSPMANLDKRVASLSAKLAPFDKYFTDANISRLTGALSAFHDDVVDHKDFLAVYSLIDVLGLSQDQIKTVLMPLGLSPKAMAALDKSKLLNLFFAKPGSEYHKLLPNLVGAWQTLSDEKATGAQSFKAVMTLATTGLFGVDLLESMAPRLGQSGVIRELVEMARRGSLNQANVGALVDTYNTLCDKGFSLASGEALLKLVGDLKLPPDDILRFLRLAQKTGVPDATRALLDKALDETQDFSKLLGHKHEVPAFLLDSSGKHLSFENLLKIETALKTMADGKFDENDVGAYFSLAAMAPYEKVLEMIPGPVLERFPQLPKLLQNTKAVTSFLAGQVDLQKAIVSFIKGDATSLFKSLPALAKGLAEVAGSKGSIMAWVEVFSLSKGLKEKVITALETGNAEALTKLKAEIEPMLKATNDKVKAIISRHPEIKTPIQIAPAPTPLLPTPARADQLLSTRGIASLEDLAALKRPETGAKLAKLAEMQGIETTRQLRPLYEEELTKYGHLKLEIGPERAQLEKLQKVKTLQAGLIDLLGKPPLLNGGNFDEALVEIVEARLLLTGINPDALQNLKLLQSVSGDKFATLLRHDDFDRIASQAQALQDALLGSGMPPVQAESLVKKALSLPELKTDFKPELMLKALDDQQTALKALKLEPGNNLATLRLMPAEYYASSTAILGEIQQRLAPLAASVPAADLARIELLSASLFKDSRFLDQGKLKPDLLKGLLKHLETSLGAKVAPATVIAQLETLHLLGPDALEKILKLPETALPASLEQLSAYAEYIDKNPSLLQRGPDKIERTALLDEAVKKDPAKIPLPKPIQAQTPEPAQAPQPEGTAGNQAAPPGEAKAEGQAADKAEEQAESQAANKAEQAAGKAEQAAGKAEQTAAKAEQSAVKAEQAAGKAEQVAGKAEQTEAKLVAKAQEVEARLAEKARQAEARLAQDLAQANASLNELLVKSGVDDAKEIKRILEGFEHLLAGKVSEPQELAAIQKGLAILKQLPPEALKSVISKNFNYRTLGLEVFASLDTVVTRLEQAGYAGPNIQRELSELLKKGPAGLTELSKQAVVLDKSAEVLACLDQSLLANAGKSRELHASVRRFLSGVPQAGLSDELLKGLGSAIGAGKQLDVAIAALGSLRPSDIETMIKHPDQLKTLMHQVSILSTAIDKAWGAAPASLSPENATKTINNPQTRANMLALLRSDRFWSKDKVHAQDVAAVLDQFRHLSADPFTANGLIKALGGLSDRQYARAIKVLGMPDQAVVKQIQGFTQEMEKLLLKAEGLRPDELLKARASFFDGLAARIVQQIDHPDYFATQVKMAQQIATSLDSLPYKLSAEARGELAGSLLRIVNDVSLRSNQLPDLAKTEAALKLLSEKLAGLKDAPAQLSDVIRGLHELSDSSLIAQALKDPDLVKGKFLEDLGKSVKTLDQASSDISQALSKSPALITGLIGIHSARSAQSTADGLLARIKSGDFDLIPGTRQKHPNAESLKLLAIAGFGVNSLDALTSLLEVGGVELLGVGKQVALAGTEFGVELLLNHYLQHPEAALPQKLKDLVRSMALASALTSDTAFEAIQTLYHPKIQDRGDLMLELAASLATQDNLQLLGNAAHLYFRKQVFALEGGKGLQGAALEKLLAGFEKLADLGGEMATTVGRKLAELIEGAGKTELGAKALKKLEAWIDTLEKGGQKAAGLLSATVEGLSWLARKGSQLAESLLARAGKRLETMAEGLLKDQFIAGLVQMVEGAAEGIKDGLYKVLKGINEQLVRLGTPVGEAMRVCLRNAGLIDVVKTETKILMQGAEFGGDAAKLEKAVARGLSGLEEAAAKKGMKTLTEALKGFSSTQRAEQFLELISKLPTGLAEKILQSEGLMKTLPRMLGRLFEIGMSVEKVAEKFVKSMNKVLPLVGIGLSSYDAVRLHAIARSGEWRGEKFEHPDVRALALVGSYVNGLDTAVSVAEIILDIPTVGTASVALLGANVALAMTELGIDLMMDYYNGPPAVQMGETMRGLVRKAATACAFVDPTIAMSDIYTFGSITTGQNLSLDVEACKNKQVSPAQKKAFYDRLAGQLANNQPGEAELARTMIQEFRFSNGPRNVSLSPQDLSRIVGPEFLQLTLQMLLAAPKSGDEDLIGYLLEAADFKTRGALLSQVVKAKQYVGAQLLSEIGTQFKVDLSRDTGSGLRALIGHETFGRLSPTLQKQLIGMMPVEVGLPDQQAKEAHKIFAAAADDSVRLELLAKLPPEAAPFFVRHLDEPEVTFLKAQLAKDPTGAVATRLYDGLLLQPTDANGLYHGLSQLLKMAPAAIQAKLLEKVLASDAHKERAAQLVLEISDQAALPLLPLEKIAKAASPKDGARLHAHALALAPNTPATALLAQHLPLDALLLSASETLGIKPAPQAGKDADPAAQAAVIASLVIEHKDNLGKLDQASLLRLGHGLVIDAGRTSAGALSLFAPLLGYEGSKTLLTDLIAQPDKAQPALASPLASLLREVAMRPDLTRFVTESDLTKAVTLLARHAEPSEMTAVVTMGRLVQGLIKAEGVPADKFAAIIQAIPPETLVAGLDQVGEAGAKALLGQLSDAERLVIFKQVLAANTQHFDTGMRYARQLLNLPDGTQPMAKTSTGPSFTPPANLPALIDSLVAPALLDKLSADKSGGEILSWIVAFGDRGQNERAFERLQKTHGLFKDQSDVLVEAFRLAEQAGIPDSQLKGKLSAQSLYHLAGPLNSGADGLARLFGRSKAFSEDIALLGKLANLADSEGRASLINSLLDNKTYDLLVAQWNDKEVEALIDKIYKADASTALIVNIKPERFAERFGPQALPAMFRLLASQEPGRDAFLAQLAGKLSKDKLREFVTKADAGQIAQVQQTLSKLYTRFDSEDGPTLLKLSAAGTLETRAGMVENLLAYRGYQQQLVATLAQQPAAELLARLDMSRLAAYAGQDSTQLQPLLDIVEKQGTTAQLKAFIAKVPATALLESLAADAGLSHYQLSGSLSKDIAALLASSKLDKLPYSIAPHMERLFQDLKESTLSVNLGEVDCLVMMANRIPAADRARLLAGVLNETQVDEADARLIEHVLKQASPEDFKQILSTLGPASLKTLGAEIGEADDKTLLSDLLSRVAGTQDAALLDGLLAGVKPADAVRSLSALKQDDQQKLFSGLSGSQYLSLGKHLLRSGDKAGLDLFARYAGLDEGSTYPQAKSDLRVALLDELANHIKDYSLAEGGDKALSWLIGLGSKASVEKALRHFKGSLANRADLVYEAIKLAKQQGVPLQERLSGEALREMMPTLNNGWDYVSKLVGSKDFTRNMALISELAQITDDRGKAHIVNGLIDKKTLDFFGLGVHAQEVKDIIRDLVGSSKSYQFVLNLKPRNVIAYFAPEKIAEMLTTLAKSNEKGKDKAISELLSAAQSFWSSTDIATTRKFYTDFVHKMSDKDLKAIPKSLRLMFDVLNSNSGSISESDYAAMGQLARGVDAEGKQYMLMQLLSRGKNLTDFVVSDKELRTALGIIEQDPSGVIARLSEAQIKEIHAKFKGSPQMGFLLDNFENHAKAPQLEQMLRRLKPAELIASLSADAGRAYTPGSDPRQDLQQLLANGRPNIPYDIQTHLRVLIGQLDYLRAPETALALGAVADTATKTLLLKDLIPEQPSAYLLSGIGGGVTAEGDARAVAVLRAINATLAGGKADELLAQVSIRSLGILTESIVPEVRAEIKKLIVSLSEAKDHTRLQELLGAIAPKDMLNIWESINGEARIQLMAKLSDGDRMKLFESFVQMGKIGPARIMLNGLDGMVDPEHAPNANLANRDVKGETKRKMLHYLADHLGGFEAKSEDMAEAGLLLILNADEPDHANPGAPTNRMLDAAFKSILDSSWWGSGADAVKKIIAHTKARQGDKAMSLLAGKLSPAAMGYAADSLDDFWTWFKDADADKENMQFVRDLAQVATPQGKAGIINALLNNWTTDEREDLIRDLIVGVKPQQHLLGEDFGLMINDLDCAQLSDEVEKPKAAGEILAAILIRYPRTRAKSNQPMGDLNLKIRLMFDNYNAWFNSGSVAIETMLDIIEREGRTDVALKKLDHTSFELLMRYATPSVRDRLRQHVSFSIEP